MDNTSVWKGMAAGFVGGLVGAFVMERFQALTSKKQDQQQPSQEEPATVKGASAISEAALDHQLTPAEKKIAGPALHYVMGVGSGAIYGAVAEMLPVAAVGAGTVFGAVLWLTADEAAVPALGFSKPPAEYPAEVHAKALASHLIYGVATDLVRRGLRKLL